MAASSQETFGGLGSCGGHARGLPCRARPRASGGPLRGGALVAELPLGGARAAAPAPWVALPGAAAANEGHEPAAGGGVRRRGGGRRPPDRAALVAGDGGSQLGLRAR